ncbi:hypothetical protein LEP1GSC051_4290 [Leptospira sp. P2653]|nr:hypothetical protein LEP1GSC051_4290 [Leptospira sp. P2653]
MPANRGRFDFISDVFSLFLVRIWKYFCDRFYNKENRFNKFEHSKSIF